MPITDSLSGEDLGERTRKGSCPRRSRKTQDFNRFVRTTAKQLAERYDTNLFVNCHQDHSLIPRDRLRPHLEKDIIAHLGSYRGKLPRSWANRLFAINSGSPETRRLALEEVEIGLDDGERPISHKRRQAQLPATQRKSRLRIDDDDDLAHSSIEFPADRQRHLVRTPSLEREDAFRDASTSQGKVTVQRRLSDPEEVAMLHSMGLLYGDDSQQSQPFDINSIQHDEPLYHIRPAKRGKRGKARGPTEPLSLDLSFSDLGDDEAIVQYIMALTRPEDGGDEAIQHASRQLPRAEPPVRVIYELDGSQPTFDVDTSQPPDLISEYDCFSEDELDDVPTQREVHDPESHADAWVILGDDS